MAFSNILFCQTNYYQTLVYFTSGVSSNVTATDTSATVTASDVQAVLNKYSIASNMIYPAFADFIESDTLLLSSSELGTTDSIKQMDKAKIFTITVKDTITRNNLMTDLKNLIEVLYTEVNGTNSSLLIPSDSHFQDQ